MPTHYFVSISVMCMKNFGAKIFLGDKFIAVKFELSHFFYHCTAYMYLVSISISV